MVIMFLFQKNILRVRFNVEIVLNHIIITQQEIQQEGNASLQKKSVKFEIFLAILFQEKKEIRKRDVGGKNPLSVCVHCFNSDVSLPISGGSTNVRQEKQQTQKKKRKQFKNVVSFVK